MRLLCFIGLGSQVNALPDKPAADATSVTAAALGMATAAVEGVVVVIRVVAGTVRFVVAVEAAGRSGATETNLLQICVKRLSNALKWKTSTWKLYSHTWRKIKDNSNRRVVSGINSNFVYSWSKHVCHFQKRCKLSNCNVTDEPKYKTKHEKGVSGISSDRVATKTAFYPFLEQSYLQLSTVVILHQYKVKEAQTSDMVIRRSSGAIPRSAWQLTTSAYASAWALTFADFYYVFPTTGCSAFSDRKVDMGSLRHTTLSKCCAHEEGTLRSALGWTDHHVRAGQFNKQDVIIDKNKKMCWHVNFACFALSRKERVCFHSLYCLVWCFVGGCLCFRMPVGLTDVYRSLSNSHLFCCHQATTIIFRSGCILIKGQGYLSLNRLSVKIGLASGNEDNTRCPLPKIFRVSCSLPFLPTHS